MTQNGFRQKCVCYVDFSKVYDKIDKHLLWNKTENIGIRGNMLNAFKFGLEHGCLLSTTAFNMYINDLFISEKH
jgi:hypothetical protein